MSDFIGIPQVRPPPRLSAADQKVDPEEPVQQRRKFILCFDGTGNKFQGNGSDSNILKIYTMLDKTDTSQSHYYQPGIGTYANTVSLSHTTTFSRLSSWYQKAKDSAVGSTLDEHVMAGYKFLMRYYRDGDEIFLFGFSRGAYIARFLAEMLDAIGLLSAGNEELIRFVWKIFSRWQQRPPAHEKDSKERLEKDSMFEYMKAFRETFSRPVRRISFLGLFDTVNSVPRFENAWMRRSRKFPYTARSSARVIRHAVAIDERRAKFRQDLVSQVKETPGSQRRRHHFRHPRDVDTKASVRGPNSTSAQPNSTRVSHDIGSGSIADRRSHDNQERRGTILLTEPPGSHPERFRSRSPSRCRSRSRSRPRTAGEDSNSYFSGRDNDEADEYETARQDIEEVWFSGGHADIGGGWEPDDKEAQEVSLSHVPLVWMVREARKAGLNFAEDKMRQYGCYPDDGEDERRPPPVPEIEVNGNIEASEKPTSNPMDAFIYPDFHQVFQSSCTRAIIHDCLSFNQGLSTGSVLSWKIMEYLPFRRMDLQSDGSWKSIRWPLPMGETRDMPSDAKIHHSVILRMKSNEKYRPGNLIIGGGGRGKRTAPEELGIGQWKILREEGDLIGEVVVRADIAEMLNL